MRLREEDEEDERHPEVGVLQGYRIGDGPVAAPEGQVLGSDDGQVVGEQENEQRQIARIFLGQALTPYC